MTDFEMLNVLTRAFGPGKNINVKYSFFLIFRDFLAFIVPPAKGADNRVKGSIDRFFVSRF